MVFLKVTRAGGPARRDKQYRNAAWSATKKMFQNEKVAVKVYCGVGETPAPLDHSILAQHAYDSALNLHVRCRDNNRSNF